MRRWLAPGLIGLTQVALCALYIWSTPLGNNGYANTPDEGAHLQYVKHIAEHWRPAVFEGYEGAGYESHQPPLYYFTSAILYRIGNEGFVRWLGVLCGLLTALVVWRWASTLRKEVGWFAGMFVAALPMNVAICSSVNNDAMTNLWFALALWQLTRPSWLLGLWIGLALLTKTTGVLLIPLVVLWLLWKRLDQKIEWSALKPAALALLLGIAIGAGWYVRNAVVYNDPLLQKTFVQAFQGTAKPSDFYEAGMTPTGYLQLVADWTFRSFFFAYGAPETANTGRPLFLPDAFYLLALAVMVAAVAGLFLRRRQGSPKEEMELAMPAGVLFMLALFAFLAFVTVFFQAQGRYFFPALGAIGLFLALGLERLAPQKQRVSALHLFALVWPLMSLYAWFYALR